ncbi:hypothetical protein AX774_g6690 [Zancudomyces culisetae]|uniref:Uncharacterized protein n=1 Tax=Zancudomyces culisetae TaxID=1213189 RepID=A0A1R1PFU9_ZANCU|nr:hypothetical protein AX774_g6690 [Zancudomyces culisetae]|eukprot:OMH79880.1 hypothetical protein AX774_g6690 [Zancudomyces culisetae]
MSQVERKEGKEEKKFCISSQPRSIRCVLLAMSTKTRSFIGHNTDICFTNRKNDKYYLFLFTFPAALKSNLCTYPHTHTHFNSLLLLSQQFWK